MLNPKQRKEILKTSKSKKLEQAVKELNELKQMLSKIKKQEKELKALILEQPESFKVGNYVVNINEVFVKEYLVKERTDRRIKIQAA